MPVITLTTDFGIKDGNVGVMKGVIWGICPAAEIADLSHMVAAQDIREGGLILARSAPYFPRETIHLFVVDPGVGTARRPMAARIGDWYFVGPDNGLVTQLLDRANASGWETEFFHLDRPEFWLPAVSSVFHGRDIFSPVAAHLANGVTLPELGSRFDDPVRIVLQHPERTATGWRGEVVHIDHFGNVASNIRLETLGDSLNGSRVLVRLGGREIRGLVRTFGERPPGEVIALFGSTGSMIVCVVNGNAAETLGVRVGDGFEVILHG
jgi:S-adenosylmethionine hydrolase